MELCDYTTEELRAELIRRRKKPTKHIPEYVEFEGIVENICKGRGIYSNSYVISGSHPLFQDRKREFNLKQPLFKVDTAPKVGDKVLLRYKKTKVHSKKNYEIFDFLNAKIIKVI